LLVTGVRVNDVMDSILGDRYRAGWQHLSKTRQVQSHALIPVNKKTL